MHAFVFHVFAYETVGFVQYLCNSPEGSTYDPSPKKSSCRYEIQLHDTKFQIFEVTELSGIGAYLSNIQALLRTPRGKIRSVFATEAVSNCFGQHYQVSPLEVFAFQARVGTHGTTLLTEA
jgi:hypothetical protein